MFSTLKVTTAATETKLTTLAQLKADGGYDDSQDTFLERMIEIASNDIAIYLRNGTDEDDDITLGRETVKEVFFDLPVGGVTQLSLGRWPVGAVTSIQENATTTTRLISGSDGGITSGDKTFTSASASFTSSYVGNEITVTGAGASGADLTTTISSVTSATEAELTDAASTTVSGANYTVEQPAFTDVYVVRKHSGVIYRRSGNVRTRFLTHPITVIYTCGWLLPGQTGRNLPLSIEEACIMYVRKLVDMVQEGQDFSGLMTGASVDGVGSFQFEGASPIMRGSGLPFEVRDRLAKYRQLTIA